MRGGMKHCPRCHARYDDSVTHCLTDGEALVADVTRTKTRDDVAWLLAQIERHGSLGYAREVARRRAAAAGAMLASWAWMKPSVHRAVLQALVDYVVERDR